MTKILDQTKLKAFADDKLNVAKMVISVFHRVENVGNGRKYFGNRRKCLLPASTLLPKVFSKAFLI